MARFNCGSFVAQNKKVKAVLPGYEVLIKKYPEPVDLANASLIETDFLQFYF